MKVKTRYTTPVNFRDWEVATEEYEFSTLKDCIRFACGLSAYWDVWDVYVKMSRNEEIMSIDGSEVCYLSHENNLWIITIGNTRFYYDELIDEITKILS